MGMFLVYKDSTQDDLKPQRAGDSLAYDTTRVHWAEWSHIRGKELHHSLLSGGPSCCWLALSEIVTCEILRSLKKARQFQRASSFLSTRLMLQQVTTPVSSGTQKRVVAVRTLPGENFSHGPSAAGTQNTSDVPQAGRWGKPERPDTWALQTSSLNPLEPHSTSGVRG